MEVVVGLNQQQQQEEGSFASDMTAYPPQPQDSEEEGAIIWGNDDSFVDQLLNLEYEDTTTTTLFPVEEDQQNDAQANLDSQQPLFAAAPTTTLDDLVSAAVPAEEADLEWVSQFMEEINIPQYSYGAGAILNHHQATNPPQTPLNCLPQAPLPHSKSRRSKRSRHSTTAYNRRLWPYSATHDPTTTSSTSSSSTGTASPPSSPSTPLAFDSAFHPTTLLTNPPNKLPSVSLRRCSHCGVQKTPQWRAGPMGAKTLCNACGVRFKSGRLFPEYRPACSPTFSTELHSNSHRKVLEMRKKKVPDDSAGVVAVAAAAAATLG